MAGRDTIILKGSDLWKGDYFKRKANGHNPLGETPIHFLPKKDKTDDWKASISDYYEYIGLSKVSQAYDAIIRNRRLTAGQIEPSDYVKRNGQTPLQQAGVNLQGADQEEPVIGYDFYPLIPNIVNLFTGYQLMRNNRYVFSAVDPFSKAELFTVRDQMFSQTMQDMRMKMLQAAESGQEFDAGQAQQQFVDTHAKFKKYQDIGVQWANRVHKINYDKFGIRNLTKNLFKESFLNTSKVITHINMMPDRFTVEDIDLAYAFHGVSPNSQDITESGMVGWFKWMNVGEILDNFGKQLKQEDIEKLQTVNRALAGNQDSLKLLATWGNNIQDRSKEGGTVAMGSSDTYDTQRPYSQQPNEPLEVNRYRETLKREMGLDFNNRTITQTHSGIHPEFTYGQDHVYRVMYLYLESQRRIGWLTKIDRTGQISFQGWVDEDFIVTEEPVYNNMLLKEKSVKTLAYGEHIDWEWVPDWRRFITISPNQSHTYYQKLGINLEKIYLDGNSLPFQFKNDKTPYGVKPPVAAMEFKMRGVPAVPVVSLLKQDQVLYNICKNRVKFTLRNDRGLNLVYADNLLRRENADGQDTGDYVGDFHNGIRNNKEIKISYDRQYLTGTGNQVGVPYTLDLSTIKYAMEYDQLAERIYYNAFRTVGYTPQAVGDIKASEEVTNVQAAQQMSQVQTEPLFDDFNKVYLPDLFTKMLEATQYYSVINEDYRQMYLNEEDENTWLDITGLDLLHKDFACTPHYEFDNNEFTGLLRRMAMDNTINAEFSTRLEALYRANDNPAKVITMLKEAEELARQNAQAAEQSKQQQIAQQQQLSQQMRQEELDREDRNKELDRKSKEYQTQMQVFGSGVQTDNNKNGQLDSTENFKNYLKDKELSTKQTVDDNKQRMLTQQHQDNLALERERLLQKDRDSQKKLEIAEVNRNRYSLK